MSRATSAVRCPECKTHVPKTSLLAHLATHERRDPKRKHLTPAIPMRTVLGQRIYADTPWHCALCKRRYRRRHTFTFWEHRFDSASRKMLSARVHHVRLCADDEHDCAGMGFAALFKEAKRNGPSEPKEQARWQERSKRERARVEREAAGEELPEAAEASAVSVPEAEARA